MSTATPELMVEARELAVVSDETNEPEPVVSTVVKPKPNSDEQKKRKLEHLALIISALAFISSCIALFISFEQNQIERKKMTEEMSLFWQGYAKDNFLHFDKPNSDQFPLTIKVLAPFKLQSLKDLSLSQPSTNMKDDGIFVHLENVNHSVSDEFIRDTVDIMVNDAWENRANYSNDNWALSLTENVIFSNSSYSSETEYATLEIKFLMPFLVKTEFTKHGEIYSDCDIYNLQKTMEIRMHHQHEDPEFAELQFTVFTRATDFHYSTENHVANREFACEGNDLVEALPPYIQQLSNSLVQAIRPMVSRHIITDSITEARKRMKVIEEEK